jgi:uncharacterized protein YkwD
VKRLFPLLMLATVAQVLAAPPGPAHAEPAALVHQMVDQVNAVRAESGLPPMTQDEALRALAFERSLDMAERRYFSHTTPEGVDVFAMIEQRGIPYRTAGENLAWNTYPEPEAAQVAFRSLLDSPPHRANLLNPEFRQLGVGVASIAGQTYFTLVFVG